MKILVLSDIHGNYPALKAVSRQHPLREFDLICNCGDSTVYCPFPNETLDWLRKYEARSIRGNTDDKIIRILQGKSFNKPSKPEKRIMYTSTADVLTRANQDYLLGLKKSFTFPCRGNTIGVFHGSPEKHEEFLFDTTPDERFKQIAEKVQCTVVLTGHSHTPYHKKIHGVHFINPGSVGRMFDANPQASYAVLKLGKKDIQVDHFRCSYNVGKVIKRIRKYKLPAIYCEMFSSGRKLN